jgi:hypothetical protein
LKKTWGFFVAAAGGDGNSSLYIQFKPSQFNYSRHMAQSRAFAPHKLNTPHPFLRKREKT